MAESGRKKDGLHRTAITILAPLDLVYRFFRDHQSRFFSPQDPLDMIEEVPGATLAWRSTGDGGSGKASFAALPGDRGTVIRLEVEIGKTQIPRVEKSLRQLRALLEGGEVPTIEGQPHGGQDQESLNPMLH